MGRTCSARRRSDTNLGVSYALGPNSTLGQAVRQMIRDQAYAFSEATILVTGDQNLLVLDPYRAIRICKISELPKLD
ncbi:MAG: hypothetical protein AAF649_06730 [Verrucomicrobiota bacterium]